MPAKYTVQHAEHKKAVEGKYGPMQVIKLSLRNEHGDEGEAEWFTKATTPLPTKGTVLEGTIERGEYGLTFKKANTYAGGGGPRPEDPKRSAGIQRMHCQKVAVELVASASRLGLIQPKDTRELFDVLVKTADWFSHDVDKARDAV